MLEGRKALKSDLDRLNQWNKANKAKCQLLPLGHNNPVHPYSLGAEWQERDSSEKALEVSQVSVQVTKEANSILASIRNRGARRIRDHPSVHGAG